MKAEVSVLPVVKAVILVDSVHNADQKMTRDQADGFADLFEKDFRGTVTPMVRGMFPAGSPLADDVITQTGKANPAMLTALGVVREKELGSISNFYATPLSRLEFLLSQIGVRRWGCDQIN